jgi:hypothetical protein
MWQPDDAGSQAVIVARFSCTACLLAGTGSSWCGSAPLTYAKLQSASSHAAESPAANLLIHSMHIQVVPAHLCTPGTGGDGSVVAVDIRLCCINCGIGALVCRGDKAVHTAKGSVGCALGGLRGQGRPCGGA